MKYELEQFAQRPLNYAIVDEVDSILIVPSPERL
jgi:protein translocase subunit secA